MKFILIKFFSLKKLFTTTIINWYVLLIIFPLNSLAVDPLSSWNAGENKTAILQFVHEVTDPASSYYVTPSQRIATFDNDGTLWVEQPMPVPVIFDVYLMKSELAKHPEWQEQPVFKDFFTKSGMANLDLIHPKNLFEMILQTRNGMTVSDYTQAAHDWLQVAQHPRFQRKYTDLVYQPMLELMAYLRTNQFQIFIVSGSSVDFMRSFTGKIYGLAPWQVLGSRIKLQYLLRNGQATLVSLPELFFNNDGEGKAIAIQQIIGQRPLIAFGNSDGDIPMLQFTTDGPGKHLGVIIHHTDAQREYAYDKDSKIGKLDKALDAAKKEGWLVIDMKKDWRIVFPLQLQPDLTSSPKVSTLDQSH